MEIELRQMLPLASLRLGGRVELERRQVPADAASGLAAAQPPGSCYTVSEGGEQQCSQGFPAVWEWGQELRQPNIQ